MNSNNRADLNPRVINPSINRSRPQNRLVYFNQSNIQTNQNAINSASVIQTSQAPNQNSITNKLCKFFKNLLELEREQGRYKESVAVIQKYINKEINIDELGVQLKGNASKTTLPESLMTSLNSNIDDLRREMFYGRVRIDGINPPPENILDLTHQMVTNSVMNNPAIINNTTPVATATISVRVPTNQLLTNQRPSTFPSATNVQSRPLQQQQPQLMQPQQQQQSSIIRPTIQALPQNRQLRPASNAATTVFTTQPVLNIANATNLRSIAPSSPIRPATISTSQIRAVSVSTAALANIKSSTLFNTGTTGGGTVVPNNGPVVPVEELKIEGVTSMATGGPESATNMLVLKSSSGDSGSAAITICPVSSNSVTLPTNMINHANYRNKIQEVSAGLNISDEALNYMSEAMENFALNLLEQAAVFACHRQELFKDNPSYRKIDDVRSQMKFLQEIEEYQRASEEEKQKAELFKQAKSRSKMDNHEQQKIKETVRKIQEHDKNCDEYSRANMTALKAIGNKRKIMDNEDTSGFGPSGIKTARFVSPGTANAVSGAGTYGIHAVPNSQIFINQNFMAAKPGRNTTVSRFRNKRIILKDFQLVLDQDVKLQRFKTYKKIFSYGRY